MIEIVVFFTGLASGLISGFIGSGGGLLMLPILSFAGIPPHTALGTARFGSLGKTFGTLARFLKSNAIKWDMIIPLTLISIPAALVGVYFVISIPQSYVENIVGVLLIVSALVMLKKSKKDAGKKQARSNTIISYASFFVTRTAQAAFGSGVGLLVNVVYVKLLRLSLTEANATKRIPGLVVIIITLVVFGTEGLIDYQLGAFLFAGTLLGSVMGAHMALSVKEKYIAFTFSLVSAGFGFLLLLT